MSGIKCPHSPSSYGKNVAFVERDAVSCGMGCLISFFSVVTAGLVLILIEYVIEYVINVVSHRSRVVQAHKTPQTRTSIGSKDQLNLKSIETEINGDVEIVCDVLKGSHKLKIRILKSAFPSAKRGYKRKRNKNPSKSIKSFRRDTARNNGTCFKLERFFYKLNNIII